MFFMVTSPERVTDSTRVALRFEGRELERIWGAGERMRQDMMRGYETIFAGGRNGSITPWRHWSSAAKRDGDLGMIGRY